MIAPAAAPFRNAPIPALMPAPPRNALARRVRRAFLALYFGTALAAYSVGPVPVQWMAQAGFIALAAGLVLATQRVRKIPGWTPLLLLLGWALMLNVVNASRFAPLMPPSTLLPYKIFVAVRYAAVFSFLAALYVAYWLAREGEGDALVRGVATVGGVIAVVSLYIYLAHMFGLPEPPRTRVGTGGGNEVQITVFSSGTGSHYRRAIGTFREPGLLAEWLLLPLFLSFAARNRFARFGRAAMAVSLLLTVSMTGILSAGFGAAAAYLLTNPFRKRHMKQLATAVVVVLVLGLLAQMAAVGIGGTSENILSILSVRVGQLSEAGVAGTDRSYVYEFLRDHPPPALGYGLGNSNLYATHETGVYALFSFLSLYVNILYSAGVVGLALLLMFLLPPVLRGALRSLRGSLGATTFILMAYLAYLAAYGATSEELSVPFAIAAALLRYATARRAAEQAAAAAPVPVPVPPPPPHPGKRPLHAEPRRN